MNRQQMDNELMLKQELAIKDRVIARLNTEKEKLIIDLEGIVDRFNDLNQKYIAATADKDKEEGEAGKEDELE